MIICLNCRNYYTTYKLGILQFYDKPVFDSKFQAWIHDTVNKEIFDRFKLTKYLYSEINEADILNKNIVDIINEDEVTHIDSLLEVYQPYSGAQLESISHKEPPWINARKCFANN